MARESFLQAISLLEEAVRRDPNFLLAYCLLCEANLDLYWQGFDHLPERRERANAALRQAGNASSPMPARCICKRVSMPIMVFAITSARAPSSSSLGARCRTTRGSIRISRQPGPPAGALGRCGPGFQSRDEVDPRNAVILQEAGFTFIALRRYAEATSLMERAFAWVLKTFSSARSCGNYPLFRAC